MHLWINSKVKRKKNNNFAVDLAIPGVTIDIQSNTKPTDEKASEYYM